MAREALIVAVEGMQAEVTEEAVRIVGADVYFEGIIGILQPNDGTCAHVTAKIGNGIDRHGRPGVVNADHQCAFRRRRFFE